MGIPRAEREKWNNAGKDVVVLHQFSRPNNYMNGSPYCLKLETYLRIADIKYENEFKHSFGSKGKAPWVTFNGKDIADSAIIIAHLTKALDKNLDEHLSPHEAAVSRMFQITMDDHMIWWLPIERFVIDDAKYFLGLFDGGWTPSFGPKILKPLIRRMIKKNVKKSAHAAGMGRHTQEEMEKIALDDLRALSVYLGDKPYLMGEKPTTADCTLYGHICQPIYGVREENFMRKAINTDEFKNLRDFADRIKEKYYPDWDDLLGEGSK